MQTSSAIVCFAYLDEALDLNVLHVSPQGEVHGRRVINQLKPILNPEPNHILVLEDITMQSGEFGFGLHQFRQVCLIGSHVPVHLEVTTFNDETWRSLYATIEHKLSIPSPVIEIIQTGEEPVVYHG